MPVPALWCPAAANAFGVAARALGAAAALAQLLAALDGWLGACPGNLGTLCIGRGVHLGDRGLRLVAQVGAAADVDAAQRP